MVPAQQELPPGSFIALSAMLNPNHLHLHHIQAVINGEKKVSAKLTPSAELHSILTQCCRTVLSRLTHRSDFKEKLIYRPECCCLEDTQEKRQFYVYTATSLFIGWLADHTREQYSLGRLESNKNQKTARIISAVLPSSLIQIYDYEEQDPTKPLAMDPIDYCTSHKSTQTHHCLVHLISLLQQSLDIPLNRRF